MIDMLTLTADSTTTSDLTTDHLRDPENREGLTIFAMPKAFRGHIGTIQRNAIESWARLSPRPQIILFGDDEGTAEIAAVLGLEHLPEVDRNEHGTPRMDGMFRAAHRAARYDVLVYVNSDIILLDDLTAAVRRVRRSSLEHFLMVGRRTDVDIAWPLDFDRDDWRQTLRSTVAAIGSAAPRVCKDYFVFRRPLFAEIPPFAIGRGAFDNWLVYHARSESVAVIDATAVVTAVHQNHDYAHVRGGRRQVYVKGEEAKRNIELAGGMRLVRGSTTDFVMTPSSIRRRHIPIDLLQFAADAPRFLQLVAELYGRSKSRNRGPAAAE